MEKVTDTYRDHPSVTAIKSSVARYSNFNLLHGTSQDINTIIDSLNSDLAANSANIPVEFIKLSANVNDNHLANIINKDLNVNSYSENTEIANVKPILKKDERTKIKNDQPVLLNIFSEIYKRFIHESLTLFYFFFQNLFQPTEKLAKIMKAN